MVHIAYLTVNGRLRKYAPEIETILSDQNIDIMAAVETHSYESGSDTF